MSASTTVVHLVRHGEVLNPEGVLYGRRPGFHLSDLGRQMAEKVAGSMSGRDVVHVVSSPLERTRETAEPIAHAHGVEVRTDDRVIESANKFEGHAFGPDRRALKDPRNWRHLWNPFKPSWGEPYADIVRRMTAAIAAAREAAEGHEAVVVSHQLPIWTTRLHVEKRSFVHDPRNRQCTLCSITSLHSTQSNERSANGSAAALHASVGTPNNCLPRRHPSRERSTAVTRTPNNSRISCAV